jgi:hypothetical protein
MAEEITYESLAERLNSELEKAQGLSSKVSELKPGQQETASMIGDTSQLPKGMSPTETISRGMGAADRFAAADYEYGQKNVLEVLSQMTSLKKQQDAYEQQLADTQIALREQELEANMKGLSIYDEQGNILDEPRRMSDAEMKEMGTALYSNLPDGEAVSAIREKLGTQVWLGKTEKERGARARDLLAKIQAGEQLELNEWLGKDDVITLKSLSQMKELWEGEEGDQDDLSQGILGGLGLSIGSFGRRLVNKPSAMKIYKDKRKSLVATLKGITGDTGVLTDTDAMRIMDALPSRFDSQEDAEKKWRDLDEILSTSVGISIDDPMVLEAGKAEESAKSGSTKSGGKWEEL